MSVALMMAAQCYMALQLGEGLVAGMPLATTGAALGFFVWNNLRFMTFMGDRGAYLLGFSVAEMGLMLVQCTPVFHRWRPVGQPDDIRLQTLICRCLVRWAVGSTDAAPPIKGNSVASPYLWSLSSITALPASIWWNNTLALAISLPVFVLACLSL